MHKIIDTLANFQKAIEDRQPVICKEGYWTIERGVPHLVRWILGREKKRGLSVINSVKQCLENLETVPLIFRNGSHSLKQKAQFAPFIKTAEIVVSHFKKHDELSRELGDLERKIIGIERRMRGPDPMPDMKVLKNLYQAAQSWKKRQIYYNDDSLTHFDKCQLYRTCRYPKFSQLILSAPAIFDSFMKWAVRDRLGVDIFVQYPATQQWLTRSYLDKRIGRLGGDGLKLTYRRKTGSILKKVVTLRIENRNIDILDDRNHVILKNDYRLSLREIFKIFQNKNYDVGNFEYGAEGIINWHPFKLGPWNPKIHQVESIDLTRSCWWEQFPHFETISAAELKQRYGIALKRGEYGIAACGSRSTPDRVAVNAHGWGEIIIPDRNGFNVFPIGKYAESFPEKWYEYVAIMASTEKARIEYPEENVYRVNRSAARLLFPLNKQQFTKMMEIIRIEIIKARHGNVIFQTLGNNCSSWVQKVLNKTFGKSLVPRLYDETCWEMELSGPASIIFGPILAFPHHGIRDQVLKLLLRLFGANKGTFTEKGGAKTYRCLSNSKFWENFITQNPPVFIQRIASGELSSEKIAAKIRKANGPMAQKKFA